MLGFKVLKEDLNLIGPLYDTPLEAFCATVLITPIMKNHKSSRELAIEEASKETEAEKDQEWEKVVTIGKLKYKVTKKRISNRQQEFLIETARSIDPLTMKPHADDKQIPLPKMMWGIRSRLLNPEEVVPK